MNITIVKRTTARQEAKAQGLQFYRSNKPCKRRHEDTLRYTSNGGCVACFKTYHYVYPKRYDREKNTKEGRLYRDRHREQVRTYIREYMRQYRKRPEVMEYDRQRKRADKKRYNEDPVFRVKRIAWNKAYIEKQKNKPEFLEKRRARMRLAYAKRKALKAAAKISSE